MPPAGPTPEAAEPRRPGSAGVSIALVGLALFGWLVWRIGPSEIWTGFRQIGWWLAAIVALGGLRFAARAAAWALAVEPPHALRFRDAFVAVICGDAVGNVTPLGPVAGEPAKVACVRGRLPLAAAFTALAIENVAYTLSVAAMIAAGTLALLASVTLPAGLQEFSEAALGAIVLFFAAAAWAAWRRPAILSRWLPAARAGRFAGLGSRLERLGAVEHDVYTFAARRRAAVAPIIALELLFHLLGVVEAHVTLWLILGAPPALLASFIVETVNRLITVAFKFVPFQVGFGEAGTAIVTGLLGLGGGPGLTLSIVRKARMGVWSLVGLGLLVRQGLTPKLPTPNAQLPS